MPRQDVFLSCGHLVLVLGDRQVVGYNTKFKGFSFVTVHESGHEVPMYQPKRGLEVLKRFLANEW